MKRWYIILRVSLRLSKPKQNRENTERACLLKFVNDDDSVNHDNDDNNFNNKDADFITKSNFQWRHQEVVLQN